MNGKPLTVGILIRDATKVTKLTEDEEGRCILNPPVTLVFRSTGQRVLINKVDQNGKYAGTIYFNGHWWIPEAFDWP